MTKPLADALYESGSDGPKDFRLGVVLPVRRDVYNGRSPRPLTRAALGSLPERVPLLAAWLATLDERDRLRADAATAAPPALAADRTVLAAVCAAEPLRRATALSSADLLRGLDRARACGAHPDKRARKAEATVLRYALRATSKTSPWSWFTSVGWGTWSATADDLDAVDSVACSRANRVLATPLVRALLSTPRIRRRLRYVTAPGMAMRDGRVTYRRDVTTRIQGLAVTREELVSVRLTTALGIVLSLITTSGGAGVLPDRLAEGLIARMPGDADTRSNAYLDRLMDERLLVPIEPADQQDDAILTELAAWLDRHGMGSLGGLLREIDDGSRCFADRGASARTQALRRLEEAWRRAFAMVGTEMPDAPAVKEDVVAPRRLRLGAPHGGHVRADLSRVAPLVELFDPLALLGRLVRDEVVRNYGPGGRCRLADLTAGTAALLTSAFRIAGDGTVAPARANDPPLPAELLDLAALRREVTAAIRCGDRADPEVELLPSVLNEAVAALPTWLRHRPTSYSFFVQPLQRDAGTGWVVNRVVGGWGRYSSRFLNLWEPGAADAVAAQLTRTLAGGRVAQFRPAAGFNANLHPLIVADEVGDDPTRVSILTEDVELAHDLGTDQVRLRIARTGEPLNVLYLGFLLPFLLPDRAMALCLDLGGGRVSLSHLAARKQVEVAGHRVTRRMRLRYGDLVLARQAWLLDPPLVADWCDDLKRDTDVPLAAVARWAARLGLPEASFLAGAPAAVAADPAELQRYLNEPKPQFVDFGSALHQRCLGRLLARHTSGVRIEEALPVPGSGPAGRRTVELAVETYRGGGRVQ